MIDRAFCDSVQGLSLGNIEVKWNTWELAERALDDGIPGDFAECGVYAGSHAAIMARVLMERGIRDRKVHLFDSFAGIPKATDRDDDGTRLMCGVQAGDRIESSGVSVCGLEQVQGFMRDRWHIDPSLLVYHAGWFRDTLPVVAPTLGPLALLRIDVDLHDSTAECVEWLYPHLSPGAYVIDDDYGAEHCRRPLEDHLKRRGLTYSPTPVPGQETTVWWRA